MRLRAIDAHAENHRAGLLIFREVALKILRFKRATACEILRIKIKDDPFAAIVLQTDLTAVPGNETEIRRGRTGGRLFLRFICRIRRASKNAKHDDCVKNFVHINHSNLL